MKILKEKSQQLDQIKLNFQFKVHKTKLHLDLHILHL